ncbi:MAG: hypothetical protein R8F63_00670 [Acidimicrobiales bacterium]|nr:hypothetical protein [Acidimicrobiales bacterium]
MAASDAQLAEWFAEFRRLAAEAEERFDAGDLRPALASLAAVPMVHQTLMVQCGELVDEASADDSNDEAFGTYL